MTAAQKLAIAKDVAREPYAWPGGYPKYLLCHDGGVLCPACVRKEFQSIASAAICTGASDWLPECADINWEGELWCDNCLQQIPSAYVVETTEEGNEI